MQYGMLRRIEALVHSAFTKRTRTRMSPVPEVAEAEMGEDNFRVI
jgi:hypothetical protein